MPRTHLPNILYCYFLLSSYYYSFIFPHILFINLPSFSFLFMCMVKLIPEAFAVHSDIKMHWQLIRACLENTQFPEGAADSLTWLAAMNHDFFFLFVCFQGQPDEIAFLVFTQRISHLASSLKFRIFSGARITLKTCFDFTLPLWPSKRHFNDKKVQPTRGTNPSCLKNKVELTFPILHTL